MIPALETIVKGKLIKNPIANPIKTSLAIKMREVRLNWIGVVVTMSSLGRKMANRQMPKAAFTGFGRTRAPKNGARAITGRMRAIKRKKRVKAAAGSKLASELLIKRAT